MSLICAISQEVPENPVISPVSGSIFERRLIEKLLIENGEKDPTNGEALTKDELIEIKTTAVLRPKAPTATSIPAILKSLQDEWDALMLYSFQTRQQLQNARQELSHSVYQHDAACRAIARLQKELEAAREALATLKPQAASYRPRGIEDGDAGYERSGAVEVQGITPDIVEILNSTAEILTSERRKKGRTLPEELRKKDAIADLKLEYSQDGLHSASNPGILCVDTRKNVVATGGQDKNITVFNKDTRAIISTLKGHSKKVVAVACHQREDIVVSGSSDNTVRVWNYSTGTQIRSIRPHDGEITGISIHATGDFVLSSSLDATWAFSDLRTGHVLAKRSLDDAPLTSAQFHPDGLIFGTGTQSSDVKIWDLKEQQNVADFQGHTGAVTAMSFSENGYYLATAGEDSTVRLWDLRKLKNFKTIQMDDDYNILDVTFDQTGTYLAFIGNDVRILHTKSWDHLITLTDHEGQGTGVRFGPHASYIVTTSMDRSLKIYS